MVQPLEYELGSYNGKTYELFAKPLVDWDNPERFVVTIKYRDPHTLETVEVARIDNKAHGHTHFDRLFEPGNPKEPFDGDIWDACKHLERNWRKYARRHETQ